MEKTLSLKAQKREQTGSTAAAKLRRQGRIPAIVYGHKKQPAAISLDQHSFVEAVHHGLRLFDVQVGRKKEKVIIKDIQYDYLGKNIIHADLIRVDVTEAVRVSVPIELKGTAKGTQQGAIIEEHTDRLEVECKVTNIPESIVVSIKELDVGGVLHAQDIELPEGVKLLSDPATLVAACRIVTPRTTEEIEEEAPAAPEVITEAKEAEQEQKTKESTEKESK